MDPRTALHRFGHLWLSSILAWFTPPSPFFARRLISVSRVLIHVSGEKASTSSWAKNRIPWIWREQESPFARVHSRDNRSVSWPIKSEEQFALRTKNWKKTLRRNKICTHMQWRIMYFINRCRFIKYIIHGFVFLRFLYWCLRRNITLEID
jgi:hypothetical protein